MKDGYLHQPFETPLDHPLVTTTQEAFRTVAGKEAEMDACCAWTDGGLLARYANIPTIVLGPGGYGAHTAEEYITIDHMPKLALIYAMAAVEFCGS